MPTSYRHLHFTTDSHQVLWVTLEVQGVCQHFADLPFPTLALIDGFCRALAA